MKNFGRALLLLTGLVLLSQAAMAQDALSVVLPAPYTSRTGSQLMYFYEDGANLGARGSFQSFLTIVNTNITTGVWVHYQFYTVTNTTSSGCLELFDFVDYLTPGQRHIIDPKGVKGTFYLTGLVGFATDGRYIMTATPVLVAPSFIAPTPADLRAVPFNWLSGQLWVSDIGKSATWMTNAVPRMAVDVLGGPLPEDNVVLLGPANGRFFQMFRPIIIAVNSFFRTAGAGAVQAGVPFGNRMSIMSFADQYTNPQQMYKIISVNATLNSFVFDNAENAFSVPPRTIACLFDYVLAPDTIGATGNFADFLGSALTSAVNNTGGWLRMRPTYGTDLQSVFGWFSQYLGTFGGGDFLIGQGRTQYGTLTIQTTDGTGVLTTPKTTTIY